MWLGLESSQLKPRWWLRAILACVVIFIAWILTGATFADMKAAAYRSYVFAKIAVNVVPQPGETMMVDWADGKLCFTRYSVPDAAPRSAILIHQVCPMTWDEYVGQSVWWTTHEGPAIRQLDFL